MEEKKTLLSREETKEQLDNFAKDLSEVLAKYAHLNPTTLCLFGVNYTDNGRECFASANVINGEGDKCSSLIAALLDDGTCQGLIPGILLRSSNLKEHMHRYAKFLQRYDDGNGTLAIDRAAGELAELLGEMMAKAGKK